MNEIFGNSAYFGILITLAAFFIGNRLKKRFKSALFNPMLIAVVLIIAVLLLLHIDYAQYTSSAKYLSYFMTPTTICLAIPLYEQFESLKKHPIAILCGILSGVISSLLCVWLLTGLFGMEPALRASLLPKSITTAIGIGLSEELGGYPALTAGVIIITGIVGSIGSDLLCRLLRITEPVAKGIAIGTSSHVIGTAHALELGEVEGAMSSLSIAISGIFTVLLCSLR